LPCTATNIEVDAFKAEQDRVLPDRLDLSSTQPLCHSSNLFAQGLFSMNTPSPRNTMLAPRARLPKAAATAALLACTLLGATAAHAALIVDSADRSVTALNPASDDVVLNTSDKADPFNFAALSAAPGSRSFARSAQNSDIQDLKTFGSGDSTVTSVDGNSLIAKSSFDALFIVSDVSIDFFGSAAVSVAGDTQNFAKFSLEQLGVANGSIVNFTGTQSGSFSGTLAPGRYALSAQAVSSSLFGVETVNQSTFNFNVSFSDPVAQPVPEPSAWAMALLGLAGCLVARRRLQARSPTAR
jgi:hypothetical protein